MRTIKQVLELFPETRKTDWHQHPNGGGWVQNTAYVEKTAYVGTDAIVYENARVYDKALVSGNAMVYGGARVSGKAMVYGNARVCGKARVSGNATVYGKMNRDCFNLIGLPYNISEYDKGSIAIGCEEHPLEYWLEHFDAIMTKHNQDEAQSAMYFNVLMLFGSFLEVNKEVKR